MRRFWARDPSSQLRPLLFRRLNRWLATDPARAGAFLHALLRAGPATTSTTRSTATGCGSTNTARCLRLLEPGARCSGPSRGRSPRTACAPRSRPASTGFSPLAQGAVPRDRDLPRGLPAARAGRPDADGPLDRGPLPVPRLPRRRVRRPAAGLAAAARPAGEVRAAQARRARAFRRRSERGRRSLPRADPRRLLRPCAADYVDLLEPERRARRGPARSETAVARARRASSSATGARSARPTRWRSSARLADAPPRAVRRQPAARAARSSRRASSSATTSSTGGPSRGSACLTRAPRPGQPARLRRRRPPTRSRSSTSTASAPTRSCSTTRCGSRAALQDAGLERGDRVALYLDNTVACAVAIFGTLLAGGAFTLVNPQTKPDKLAYILDDSGARSSSTEAHSAAIATEAVARGAARRARLHRRAADELVRDLAIRASPRAAPIRTPEHADRGRSRRARLHVGHDRTARRA